MTERPAILYREAEGNMNVLWWIVVVLLGLITLNVIVFGLLAINDHLERRHRK